MIEFCIALLMIVGYIDEPNALWCVCIRVLKSKFDTWVNLFYLKLELKSHYNDDFETSWISIELIILK